MLIKLSNIKLSYSDQPLLDGVELVIAENEKLCLVGRNGAGKSRLLNILAGHLVPDSGSIEKKQQLKIAMLAQEVPTSQSTSVFEVVLQPFAKLGQMLTRYQQLSLELDQPGALAEFERLQHDIETQDGWRLQNKVETILSRFSLNAETNFASLSGGWKRRVLLAQALVTEPDILLLDEPTNHLDIEAIEWLENFVQQYPGTIVLISHDRRFVEKTATRIIELDRGKLLSFSGNYQTYLKQKEDYLSGQEAENQRFDKRLAQEEVWVRQGIKARRTRNEGRVRALKAMRQQKLQRREKQGTADIRLDTGEKSGALVIEAKNVSYRFNDNHLIDHFNCTIMRGDKIGILGPNGCGKSTLLNILLKKLTPTMGEVRHGTQINIAYFDQLRAQIDLDKSVLDNVVGGSSHIDINGQRIHAMGYLQNFLFSANRAMQPAKALSGGERNRLLLAKLFTQPANLLIMDEPTNDLDMESLELLESLLVEYSGTLLLVCHDREFINNVVTSSFVFEGNGKIQEYVGGYDDYLQQRIISLKPAAKEKKEIADTDETKIKKAKLSFNEQRELKNLPNEIEKLETEINALQEKMGHADFYQQPASTITETNKQLQLLQESLEAKYARWDELEAK